MANYVFESMTQQDAAAFGENDYLLFISSSTSATNVSIAPYSSSDSTSGPLPGTVISNGISFTAGGKTLVFPNTLADASQSDGGSHIVFNDQSHLIIGSNAEGDTFNNSASAATDGTTVFFGLGGNDTYTAGAGNDYVYGGVGNDTINGGNGNYHIYGNAAGSPAALTSGQTDVDQITVGTGTNYIQGNAGNDTITVGTTASTGTNRVFGGADDDNITLNGAQGSVANVNGNKGVDTIIDNSAGVVSIRGGQDNDTITQTGSSRGTFSGDLGDDTLTVSGATGHVAVLTGGAGSDTFNFSNDGAGAAASLSANGTPVAQGTAGSTLYYQTITDFTAADDHINLGTAVDSVGYSNTNFASVQDAAFFANTQLSAGSDVSSLSVGSQTYLFYNDADGLGIINLSGTTASSITADSFTAPTVTPTPDLSNQSFVG